MIRPLLARLLQVSDRLRLAASDRIDEKPKEPVADPDKVAAPSDAADPPTLLDTAGPTVHPAFKLKGAEEDVNLSLPSLSEDQVIIATNHSSSVAVQEDTEMFPLIPIVELLGSPYYKGVPLPRIPSVHKLGTKSRIAQRPEHATVDP